MALAKASTWRAKTADDDSLVVENRRLRQRQNPKNLVGAIGEKVLVNETSNGNGTVDHRNIRCVITDEFHNRCGGDTIGEIKSSSQRNMVRTHDNWSECNKETGEINEDQVENHTDLAALGLRRGKVTVKKAGPTTGAKPKRNTTRLVHYGTRPALRLPVSSMVEIGAVNKR